MQSAKQNNFTLKTVISGLHDKAKCRIVVNNNCVYDDFIFGDKVEHTFTLPLLKTNTLSVEHYDKKFGENRRWDKQELVVHDIILDDVSIKRVWQQGHKEYYHQGVVIEDPVGMADMMFGFNGKYSLEFTSPVYDWIIVNRKKIYSPFRDKISSVDYHNREYNNVEEIERMIASIREKLSKV